MHRTFLLMTAKGRVEIEVLRVRAWIIIQKDNEIHEILIFYRNSAVVRHQDPKPEFPNPNPSYHPSETIHRSSQAHHMTNGTA
jgi:hypothetical protein